MTMTRRAALLSGAGLMLAGTAPVSSALAQAAAAPRRGGVLTVHLGSEQRILNPALRASTGVYIITSKIIEPLVDLGTSGRPEGVLATSWDASEDGKTITFKLREGVKWHDGKPFTSADVAYSAMEQWKKHLNYGTTLQLYLDAVETPDAHTAVFRYSRPMPLNLLLRALCDLGYIVPKHVFETGNVLENPANTAPIGTGPFKFDSWARGSAIRLVKSDAYWGEPAALDRVEFRIVPDAAAAVPAVLSGDVQLFPFFPPDAMSQIEGNPNLKIEVGLTEGETILSMNNKKTPFDKLEVRQAVASAIDRKAIIDAASNGLGQPIGSHMSPANPAYVDLTGTYPLDLDKAKEYLAAAGLSDGFKSTIKLPPTPYARLGGEVIAAELRKIGIDLEIIPVEWADWLSKVYTERDYDMSIVSHTEANDIDIYARPNYYIGYENPAFNTLADELQVTNDEARRKELLAEMQTVLAKDVPAVFLFELPKVGVWDAKLEGIWKNAPIQANDLTKAKWVD